MSDEPIFFNNNMIIKPQLYFVELEPQLRKMSYPKNEPKSGPSFKLTTNKFMIAYDFISSFTYKYLFYYSSSRIK